MKSREVPSADWGQYLLDDVLFLAADQLNEAVETCQSVEVAVRFRITADAAASVLRIQSDGAADGTLTTSLPYPF